MISPRGLVRDERAVLTLSGMVGIALGLRYANWQWAVEIAQVQVGRVAYAPDSIPGMIQGTLWSLTNQLAGVPLLLGMSERTASALVSAAIGGLWFEAMTFFVFAWCRNAPLALWATAVCFLSGATLYGGVYPVLGLATPHTHGVVSLMIPMLAVGLLGAERRRSGAFVLGLAPAFHAATGVFVLASVCVAFIMTRRVSWPVFRPAAWYLAGGLGVAFFSLLLHLGTAPQLPSADAELSSRVVSAFIELWDGHRVPIDWTSGAVMLALGSISIALVGLGRVAAGESPTHRFLLAFVLVSCLGGLIGAVASHIPHSRMPGAVVAAMPGRLINLASVMFMPLLFGLIGRGGPVWVVGATVAVVSGGLLATGGAFVHVPDEMSRAWLFVVAGLLAATLGLPRIIGPNDPRCARGAMLIAPTVLLVAVTVGAGAIAVMSGARRASGPLWDKSNESVLSVASGGAGLLLTGGDQWLVQLQTRRPILLEGGTLDTLPYVPEAAGHVERVLREVYGVDVFVPPDTRRGVVPDDANQLAWEGYSPERWLEIKSVFGVTQVLTESSWVLHLPLVASGPGLRLYAIDGSAGARGSAAVGPR